MRKIPFDPKSSETTSTKTSNSFYELTVCVMTQNLWSILDAFRFPIMHTLSMKVSSCLSSNIRCWVGGGTALGDLAFFNLRPIAYGGRKSSHYF